MAGNDEGKVEAMDEDSVSVTSSEKSEDRQERLREERQKRLGILTTGSNLYEIIFRYFLLDSTVWKTEKTKIVLNDGWGTE